MMMKKRFKRKRGPVRAKKVMYDGITFASGLEKYMYMALRKAKIKTAYEGMTYEIFPGFMFDNESYERQANGKGDLVNRGSKKSLVLSILLILLDLQMKLLLSVKGERMIRFRCVGNCLKNS